MTRNTSVNAKRPLAARQKAISFFREFIRALSGRVALATTAGVLGNGCPKPLKYTKHRVVTLVRQAKLGGKAVRAGMGAIYKSAGAQPATVSHRLPLIVKVRNIDHLFTISLCAELVHSFLHFRCLQLI